MPTYWLGCGEGNYSIYCRTTSKENGQLMLTIFIFPNGFQGNITGDGPRVIDQLLKLLDWFLVR